jgi:hypothetical protein
MKAIYGTYELCIILLGFMSYVFMKTLKWKNSYLGFGNYEKYILKILFCDLKTMENIIKKLGSIL